MAVAARKSKLERIEFHPPLAPSDRPHKAVKDQRVHFAKVTAKQPVDRGFRTAFEQSKMLLAHTQPTTDLKLRDLAVRSVAKSLGGAAALKITQPVPGGVGYGMFYTDGFKTGWGRGTSFAFDVICPTPPGGNVNTFSTSPRPIARRSASKPSSHTTVRTIRTSWCSTGREATIGRRTVRSARLETTSRRGQFMDIATRFSRYGIAHGRSGRIAGETRRFSITA